MNDYQLRIENERKHVFVTQLREEEDDNEDVRQVPVVREKAGQLLETGINTLQATLLLKKELEVDQIQFELDSKKKEFAERIDACKEKEAQLKKKQAEIKERIDKFDKFIKENEAKRRRALQKYQQEVKIKEHKTSELENLQVELTDLMVRHQRLKNRLIKYAAFENYLTMVVDRFPEDYLEATDNIISALMMRYQTLSSTNETLLQNLNKSSDEVESGQQVMQDLALNHTQQLLVYNGELASLQKRYEQIAQKNVKLENKYMQTRSLHREQSQTLGQIKIAIENIFDRCRGQRYGGQENLSFEKHLDIIGNYLLERESVLSIASTS